MKKILLVAYFFEPFNNGGVQRIKCFKKYMKEFGYEIDILTTNVMGTTDNDDNVIRIKDTGDILRHNKCPIVAYPSKVLIKLFMYCGLLYDWFSFWNKNIESEIETQIDVCKYDYIMASYPPITDLIVGLNLSKKYDVPLIVDYRDGLLYDPFPYILEQSKRYRNKIQILENEVANKSILQIVVNEQMKDYYNEKYPFRKTIVIPNGFDSEESFLGEPLKLPEGINIVYTGLLGEIRFEYCKKVLTSLLSEIKNINLIYIGNLEAREREILGQYKNFFCYDQVPRNVSILTQRAADLLLLITGDSLGGTSGKLYEYLFANRPILHIGNIKNNASNIIKETNAGESFDQTMYLEIKKFICNFVSGDKKQYKFRNIDKFNRKSQSKELAHNIDML